MTNYKQKLIKLRTRITTLNNKIIANINKIIELSNQIKSTKDKINLLHLKYIRKSQSVNNTLHVVNSNYNKINNNFPTSKNKTKINKHTHLNIKRLHNNSKKTINVAGILIGKEKPVLIGGPCSIENYEQMLITATKLKALGIPILRGGAFKPRSSPYNFQGLGKNGLKILRAVGDEVGMSVITEVISVHDVELVMKYADIIQVGTRNMFNYSLLKELGYINKPVMLKRSFMATIEEFMLAAEYIYMRGNQQIILCERGIRTFETWTRNTLDISSVPILKKETILPIIVDISHALGRKDIIKPIAYASLAAGADGLMFECHHNPTIALSDNQQQLNLQEAKELIKYLKNINLI